jgi:hypothetical protein
MARAIFVTVLCACASPRVVAPVITTSPPPPVASTTEVPAPAPPAVDDPCARGVDQVVRLRAHADDMLGLEIACSELRLVAITWHAVYDHRQVLAPDARARLVPLIEALRELPPGDCSNADFHTLEVESDGRTNCFDDRAIPPPVMTLRRTVVELITGNSDRTWLFNKGDRTGTADTEIPECDAYFAGYERCTLASADHRDVDLSPIAADIKQLRAQLETPGGRGTARARCAASRRAMASRFALYDCAR